MLHHVREHTGTHALAHRPSRPELICRAVDSFAKQGRATLGEVAMKFLEASRGRPDRSQCPECHKTFAHMQKEWREINAQKETATKGDA